LEDDDKKHYEDLDASVIQKIINIFQHGKRSLNVIDIDTTVKQASNSTTAILKQMNIDSTNQLNTIIHVQSNCFGYIVVRM
jgi:phosphoribosylamine-glycine ligase